jgi:hypothetical protein
VPVHVMISISQSTVLNVFVFIVLIGVGVGLRILDSNGDPIGKKYVKLFVAYLANRKKDKG